MKAGDRYPATVPDIDQRLVDQWRRHRYGVTVEQARDILQQLSNDPTLLQKCAQWKVNITHVIWDMTVASAWREILTQKIDDRRQTKDSLKKTEQRKPSDDVLDVPKLFRRRFVADYSIKTLNEQLARENAILSKYSAFPRMAGHAWRSDSQGRPADTPGQWLPSQSLVRPFMCRTLFVVVFWPIPGFFTLARSKISRAHSLTPPILSRENLLA